MTLEELDQKLAGWQTDLDAISTKLVNLEGMTVFKTAKSSQLTGNTKTRADEAFTTVERLWEYHRLLREVYDKAVAKRAEMPKLFRGALIDEIEKLLTGSSITLPQTQTSSTRDLFAGTQRSGQTITPDRLKETMAEAYAKAVDFFEKLMKRWLDLIAAIEEPQKKLNELKGKVTALGKPVPAELSDVEARVASLERRRMTDPLSLTPDEVAPSLKTYMQKAQIRVIQMEREQEAVAGLVDNAYTRLEKVKNARIAAMTVVKRVTEAIADESLIATPEKTTDLADMLAILKELCQERKFADAETGLTNWIREASRLERSYAECTQKNEALLQRAADIDGRFGKAKLRRKANEHKGLKDDRPLDRFEEQFEAAKSPRFDFKRAEQALSSYETRIGELVASFENKPPAERLKDRLAAAKGEADKEGFGDHKALNAFAGKADEALSAGDLEKAESWIHSYEVKVGELKANPPERKSGNSAPSGPAEAKPPATPPADEPSSLEDRLKARLAAALKKADAHGYLSDKALTKFAEKAEQALQSGNATTADRMVYSYETKLSELIAQNPSGPDHQASAPAGNGTEQSSGSGTSPGADSSATSLSPKEGLAERLAAAKAKAEAENVHETKSLKAYAQKAEQALAQDNLDTARHMIESYETKLGEIVAKQS